jgi:hypothetical protein
MLGDPVPLAICRQADLASKRRRCRRNPEVGADKGLLKLLPVIGLDLALPVHRASRSAVAAFSRPHNHSLKLSAA